MGLELRAKLTGSKTKGKEEREGRRKGKGEEGRRGGNGKMGSVNH